MRGTYGYPETSPQGYRDAPNPNPYNPPFSVHQSRGSQPDSYRPYRKDRGIDEYRKESFGEGPERGEFGY